MEDTETGLTVGGGQAQLPFDFLQMDSPQRPPLPEAHTSCPLSFVPSPFPLCPVLQVWGGCWVSSWPPRLSDLRELGGTGLGGPQSSGDGMDTARSVSSPPAKAAPGEGAMLMLRLALPQAWMAASCFPEGTGDGRCARQARCPRPCTSVMENLKP